MIRICQLVEGLPLAIELAASWVRHMAPAAMVAQIQHNSGALAATWRDAPERHRSLDSLFEHSWRLLSHEEQAVLMRLAILRGGFDATAAGQVADATPPLLAALVDKSLVLASPSGRYGLHELIRQAAHARLADVNAVNAVYGRHLEYFVAWAERADTRIAWAGADRLGAAD